MSADTTKSKLADLARILKRQAANSPGGDLYWHDTVSNEVLREFNQRTIDVCNLDEVGSIVEFYIDIGNGFTSMHDDQLVYPAANFNTPYLEYGFMWRDAFDVSFIRHCVVSQFLKKPNAKEKSLSFCEKHSRQVFQNLIDDWVDKASLCDSETSNTKQTEPNKPNSEKKYEPSRELKNYVEKLAANRPLQRGDLMKLAREITAESTGNDPKAKALYSRFKTGLTLAICQTTEPNKPNSSFVRVSFFVALPTIPLVPQND